MKTHRLSTHRLIWSLGIAATVTVIAVMVWNNWKSQGNLPDLKQPASSSESSTMVPLRTNFPPELIEGTPKPINVPGLWTPNYSSSDAVPAPTAPRVAPSNLACNNRYPERKMEQLGRTAGLSLPPETPPENTERYGVLTDNSWQTPKDTPLSTFSIDVDTASYSNLRRLVLGGGRIPQDAVRLEEMVNYFDYAYSQPADDRPFAVHVDNAGCPWNPDHQLVRVALKGREVNRTEREAANLVFLLDVSGSMESADKLPLVIESFKLLLEEMNASDTIAIIVYAGAEGLALPPTACDESGRQRISAQTR